ncbi:MAG: cytidine deaminase [Bacteroidaceae bacterium]|nr:cytidine deaminase [Bacteroidaceae bacterium]
MEHLDIHIAYQRLAYEELAEADRALVDRAKEATFTSYAPYSRFSVGAAALLDTGETVCGSNQENAATPNGICAERTALSYIGAAYPQSAVKTLAIAARDSSGQFTERPIPPCGMCRQVLAETEQRHDTTMRVLLYGTSGTYVIEGVSSLLPFSFDGTFL